MKKLVIILSLIFSVVLFTNCEENDDTPAILGIDFVGFESDFQIGVDPNGMATQEVKVAISQASASDRIFNIAVDTNLSTADASAYSLPSTITIPANSTVGSFMVDIIGENISSSGDDLLIIQITSDSEDLFKSDPIALNLRQVCPVPETSLEIVFDGYASESAWGIFDSGDNLLFSGNGYADGDANFSSSFCLSSGSYTFLMTDSFGDGLSFPADGSITITQNGVLLVSIVGNFGESAQQGFTIP